MRLEEIANLSERLRPLSGRIRGMRIEAEEWNALVDVLSGILQINRAQERGIEVMLEDQYASKAHEHLGQVSLGWLDPVLQPQLARRKSTIAQYQQISQLKREVESLGTQVARLAEQVENQQRLVDRTLASEIDRGGQLRDFEERFSQLDDFQSNITQLSADVQNVSDNVDIVLELRETLEDDQGNPIDVSQLREDIEDLSSLRENLEGVDGTLVRFRDFEIRVCELEDVVGLGESSLETRLNDLSASIEDRLDQNLVERDENLRQEFNNSIDEKNNELRTEMTHRLGNDLSQLSAETTARITESEERMQAHFNQQFSVQIPALRADLIAAVNQEIDDRLSDLPGQIDASVAVARDTLERQLTETMNSRLTTELNSRFGEVNERVSEALGDFDNSLNRLRDELPNLIQREVESQSQELSNNLNQIIDGRFSEIQSGLDQTINARVTEIVDGRLDEFGSAITRRLEEERARIDAQIETSVTNALRNLPEEIGQEVRTQIEELDLDAQIQQSTDNLRTEFRAGIERLEARINAEHSRSISNVVTTLRREVALSSQSTERNANQHSGQLVSNLREELNKSTDERIGELETALFRTLRGEIREAVDESAREFEESIEKLRNEIDRRR